MGSSTARPWDATSANLVLGAGKAEPRFAWRLIKPMTKQRAGVFEMIHVRKQFASALAITAAMTLAVPAIAAQARQTTPSVPAPSDVPGYTMPSTHMWDMTSDGGEIYRIFVSFPATEIPADGYPVLYVLDGNAMFAAFAETRRIQEYYDVGKAIVVGVGYPGDQPYDARRLNDYTPPLLDPPPANVRRLAQYKSGGQDKFLDFLTGKLRTEIGKRYKINADRQSLFGHSLGGLVALHTLYTRPQAFYSIVAASPSLEWNEQGELREEREFAARLASGKMRQDQPADGGRRWPRH